MLNFCGMRNKYNIISVTLLLLSCGNGGKNDAPIDGGHGIGIDTATVNEIQQYVDSIKAIESTNGSE